MKIQFSTEIALITLVVKTAIGQVFKIKLNKIC